MDRHIEDAFGLLAILVLLPVMLFVVLPGTFLFDAEFGILRRRAHRQDVSSGGGRLTRIADVLEPNP